MSDSVDRVFVHALNTVKKIPRTGSARPPPADRLRLYGLYKQSMEGDVDGVMDRPEGDGDEIRAEQDKWDAWNQQKGLSRTEAKRRYISTLIDTMHKYATSTPDARELVSELEFVWDQIKSNVPSSSSSSPVQNLGAPPPYPSFGGRPSQDEAAMRVLSPVSQRDEEEDEGDEFDDAMEGQYEGDHDEEDDDGHAARPRTGKKTNDIRNRKWRRRVEQALVKMTAELAALREQIETRHLVTARRRKRLWMWIFWICWLAIRHIIVNAIFCGILFWWIRKTRDRRLETAVRLLLEVGKDRLKALRNQR